jgi:cardiolipin synthase
VAALARHRLWLTDAYYAATSAYVEALRAAARDGVDVRLLVPGGTDIPLLRPLSRAGYRGLLEAGVRVFEWNGSMLHAKTAVADGRWARVGSTNLNVASWLGNCELDVVVEDEVFARDMEAMYLDDLTNATEIVLGERRRRKRSATSAAAPITHGTGSAGRATAGVLRIGHTVGAAISNHRALGPAEWKILLVASATLIALTVLIALFPRVFAYPIAALTAWVALALLYRAVNLRHQRWRHDRHHRRQPPA